MPLMMFIPADEAQLGRWDLCEPERKRPLEGGGPNLLSLSGPPGQVGRMEPLGSS